MHAPVLSAVDDRRAAPEKIVDGAGDRFLVPRNRRGRNEHDIALADADAWMLGGGDTRESGCRFTLAASQHQHASLLRQAEHFIERDEHAIRWREVAELDGDAGVLLHAPSGDGNLAVVFLGGGERS